MDDLVLDQIRNHILLPDNLSELGQEVAKELNNASNQYSDELKSVKKEIIEVNKRLEYHYEFIESGKVLLRDIGSRIYELSERKDKLELRKRELELIVATKTIEVPNMEELRDWTKDLKRLLESGSITERQVFIRSFVKEIKVTGDEAKLTYTMPELPQNQNDGRMDSSCIVQYGGRYWTIDRTRTFELAFSL